MTPTPTVKHRRKPTVSEKRALLDSIHDDHRYTSKLKQHKPNRVPSPALRPSMPAQPSHSSILRQFLLCREPLNPNKGSDVAVAEEEEDEEHLTSGALDNSSQLSCMFDMNMQSPDSSKSAPSGSTLECLLTGQMNQRDVAAHEQRLIDTRRRISADITPTSPMSIISDSTDSASNSYDDPYATAQGLAALSGMDLLTMSANDLTSLWQRTDTNHEVNKHLIASLSMNY